MNRKALLIGLLVVIVLALGGYGLYQYLNTPKAYPLKALVPPDAVLVYSSSQPELAWDSLQQHAFGEVLKGIPAVSRINGYEEELKRLLPRYEELKDRELFFSLHITERNHFDYLLLMSLESSRNQRLLQDLRKEIEQTSSTYQLVERVYQGVQIFEIRGLKEGRSFSFFAQDGVMAGSFTSFLVEAAIRQKTESNTEGAIPVWLTNVEGTAMSETLGSLTLNLQQLPNLLRMFANSDSLVQEMLPRLPYSSRLDVVTADDGLLLTGFTQALAADDADFLWAMKEQKPQPMRLDYLVPLRAASLMFVGLSTPVTWHERLRTYWERKAPEQWERWQVLEAKAPQVSQLIPLLGKEVGMAVVPAVGNKDPDRLLFLHVADSGAAGQYFAGFIKKLAPHDTLYSELFLRQTLQELPYVEFPAALLGSAYVGFKESYFTQVDDYLIISSSIPALKEMLLDMQAEETWQRSVRLHNFISRLDADQNYALYLNTTALWPMLYRRLAQPWKKFWDSHSTALRQVDLLSLQLSAAEGSFYTNLFLHLDKRPERHLEQLQLSRKSGSALPWPVVHAPAAVGHRLQRGGHWLVQDSARILYLLNTKGEAVRSAPLGGYWQEQVVEVDPQKNKNIHYFLTTPDSAYLLQPNLQPLRPFPLALPAGEKIQWASVLDYDGSRRYRFLLTSASGKLYMYDLDGSNLEGWQPLSLSGGLSAAPGHIRVRSRDIIYAFQKKGVAWAFTRRGEALPGFPLQLGDSLLGPVHVQPASDFSGTRFVTVSASGLLLEWNLEGQVLRRKQLYRPDARARFYLVPDSRSRRFLIAQQDRFRLRLLDENGSELFEKDYLGAGQLKVQFFPFADAAALVAVTDVDQEFTYLYDLKGNLLQTQPLNSCCPIALQASTTGDSIRLVKAYDRTVDQFLLPFINSSK